MKKSNLFELDRREFIIKAIPACAVSSLGLAGLPVLGQLEEKSAAQEPKHKFDAELTRTPTYKQIFDIQYKRSFIPFLLFLSEETDKANVIALLKKYASNSSARSAKMSAQRRGKNDFETLKSVVSPSNPGYKNTLTIAVTENTEKVYEIKITECLWSKPWLESKAGDLGFAALCYGDYAWIKAFNSEFEMVRDKTLMQGHDCCNNRYLWKG